MILVRMAAVRCCCSATVRRPFVYVLNAAGTQLTILQNGNPNPVLQVTLTNATGGYEVTQLGPIVHPPGFGENDVAFAINYRVTDANGDFIDGVLPINVDDDTPVAVADTNSGIEGGLVSGNVLTDGTDDLFGADGAATTVPAGGVTGVAAGSNTLRRCRRGRHFRLRAASVF